MKLGRIMLAVLALFASLLSGCLTDGGESEWRWKQSNPEYRSPWPQDKAVAPMQF